MNHVMTGCAACSLLTLALCGCGPELAQTQLGAEEEQWQTQIRASYSSWQAPRSAPPATFDNRDSSLTNQQPAAANDTPVTVEPKDDPAKPAPDTVGIPKDTQENAAAQNEKPQSAADEPTVAPVPADGVETYTVQKGDTLSKLAKIFYGDGRRYMPIVKANEEVLKGNPNRIYPGMKLNIPKR